MPKRHGNLWSRVKTKANADLAIEVLIPQPDEKNPRQLTREEQDILDYRQEVIDDLVTQLETHQYNFGEVKTFNHKEGRKVRTIHYLPKKGSLLLQCVQNVMQDIFVEKYIKQTYSSIKGRGMSQMTDDIVRAIIEHPEYDYVVEIDAQKCYESTDHGIMLESIKHAVKDVHIIEFYRQMLALCRKGIAIGFLPNHYLMNLLMSSVDHVMKEFEHCMCYFRYMDDILILCKKEDAVRFLKALEREFAKIGMTIKNTLRMDYLANGIDYCGIVYYPNGHRRLRRSMVLNIKARDRELRKKGVTAEEYKIGMASYHGWMLMVDGQHLMHSIYKEYYDIFFKHKRRNKMDAVRLSDVKQKWFGMDHDRFVSTCIDNDLTLYENDFTVLEIQNATFDGEPAIVAHLSINGEEYYTISKSKSLVERFPRAWERVGNRPFVARLQMQPSKSNPRHKYPVLV